MGTRRFAVATLVVGVLAASACSQNRESTDLSPGDDTAPTTVTSTPSARSTPSTTATTTPTTRRRPGRDRPRRTTTTTTTLVPARGAANPRCVVRIRTGDSLFAIAEAARNPAVTITSLQRENRIRNPDRIDAGDLLDICVRNKINDINGKKRAAPNRQNRPDRQNRPNRQQRQS